MGGALKVYIDLNHWYALGQAAVGEGDAGITRTYSRLHRLVQTGAIQCPLSSVHYMELSENPNFDLRFKAGLAMSELSRFVTLAPIGRVVREEMRDSLFRLFARPFRMPIEKIGFGAEFAFGAPNSWVLTGGTDEQRAELEKQVGMSIAELTARVQRVAEFWVLVGPDQAMLAQLESYDPYAARRLADEELKQFNVMLDTLRTDPDIRRRPMDAIAARELLSDVYDAFTEVCRAGGFVQSLPFRTKQEYTAFLLSLPSRHVSMSIKLHYLQDVQRDWTINDFRDIHALSLAIPYCDLVVTDKKAWDVSVNRARLDEFFGTRIFARLDDLISYLDDHVPEERSADQPHGCTS